MNEKEFTYFWDRFQEIFSNGWIANEYTELYTEDLVSISDFLTKNYPRDLSLPKIFAVGDDVILEWNLDNNDISLEIKIWSLQGLWHNLNLVTGEEEEFTVDLVHDDNWINVFNKIREISKAKTMTGVEALSLLKDGKVLRRESWEPDQKCKSIDFLGKLYIHYVKPIVPPEEIDENLETLFSSGAKISFKEQTFSEFLGSVDAGEFLYDDWEIVE